MRSAVPLALAAAIAGLAAGEAAPGAKPKDPDVPAGKTRGEKALKGGPMPYWPDRPDQARPLTATFIGGKGHEWLCAGGFQPDGTVVLAGNVNGGEFGLAKPESVLGKDAQRPPPAAFQETTAKGGEKRVEKPDWRRPDATGFLVFASSDLRSILRVVRLPWTSAAITSMAVGADGAIYLAGRPGSGIAGLGGRQAALPVAPDAERKGGEATAAFIAKLAKDGGAVEWLFTLAGPTDAPRLSLAKNGEIVFGAQDLRRFAPDGRLLSAVAVPGGVRETTSVSPVDGTVVRGGERNTGTGREPWRCPILKVLEPDGAIRYQLYEWPSRYVGLDTNRLVSDTAVRMVSHDAEGNILAFLWSDGGNSVATRQPTDIGRGAGTAGLGLNSAGAGVTSLGYLVRIEPKDHQLIGWTMWLSKYAGRANGAAITAVAQAGDGSVLFAGDSAWGLIQTGNKLANGEPAGIHVAVLTPDMTGARFCSAVPGLGAAQLGNDPDDVVAIGSGMVGGKPRALFLGGAAAEADVYGLVTRTPTLDAMQPAFGGGASDGYVVMLDLSPGGVQAKAAPPPQPPQRLLVLGEGAPKGAKREAPKDGEPTSTRFAFLPDTPRWLHADAEFRVADGSYWPHFIAGRPDGGEAAWSETGTTGSFSATFDLWAQDQGRQDRRVLGQLFAGGTPPKLAIAVPSFGTRATETGVVPDARGNPQERVVDYQPADAALTIGGKTVKVPFKVVFKRGRVVESSMQRLNVAAFATVEGSALGLAGDLAEKQIDIRINVQAVDPATAPAGKKRGK